MATAKKKAADAEDFTSRVWRKVQRCPRGRIVSYGGIAALLGHPRAARGVGRALSALPDGSTVPWWRVVNRNGEISIKGVFQSAALQRRLLEAEGVKFDARGRIDWKRFGWNPNTESNADRGSGIEDRGKGKGTGIEDEID